MPRISLIRGLAPVPALLRNADTPHHNMTIGVYERATPKLRILRGDIPTIPSQRSQRHAPKTGEDIKSGQLISYSISDDAWVKGMADGNIPYLAREDDTELDVLGSGLLTGASIADPYRVQTAFFTAGTYAVGTQLTWDTGGNAGNIKEGSSGDVLIGTVAFPGKVDIASEESGVVKDNTGAILVITWDTTFTGALIP